VACLESNVDAEARAFAYLRAVHHNLSNMRDLSPKNPDATRTLSGLVETLLDWRAAGLGADWPDRAELGGLAVSLADICARAESLMEFWWARRLLAEGELAAGLPSFWYFDNYRALVDSEVALIRPLSPSRIVFLGSGAFPLTALLLAEGLPLPVACVDHDAAACAIARDLLDKAQLSERVSVHRMEAAEFPFERGDLALCASLLRGTSHHASLVAAGVRHVILRNTEGVLRFCYHPAALLPSRYALLRRADPDRRTINHSAVYIFDHH
jgi:hypothetical protein